MYWSQARTTSVFIVAFLLGGLLSAQEEASAPALHAGWARTSARVEIGIVRAPPGSDFNSYIETSILPLIRANWYRLASKSGEKAGGDATLQFTILKDGGVSDVKVTDGSGHAALGDLAMDAVRKAGPFAPLPAEFSGQSVSVRGHFFYEPEARALNAEPTQQNGSDHEVTINGVTQTVYRVGKGVTAPRITYNPEPEFSDEARKKKIDGVVTLSMVVTSEGNTDQIKVVKGLGHGLDEKAMDAVSKWKFQPATKDGKPVSVEIAVEVDFHLMKGPR